MSVRLEDLCKTIDVLQNREKIFVPTTISFYMVPLVGFCSLEYFFLLCTPVTIYSDIFKLLNRKDVFIAVVIYTLGIGTKVSFGYIRFFEFV